MDKDARAHFVESWGSLGVLWGINRSMARVQALLMCSPEALCLDDIADALEISRGNASMSLKELRAWGVVHRVHQPGDRRDWYVPEDDAWQVLFRILAERKRREYDPALDALRTALDAGGGEKLDESVRDRLQQFESILALGEAVADKLLSDPQAAEAFFAMLVLGADKP